MALNVNRWLKYAKARIDSAVGSGHESLDRLEAEQEAKRADKPWLASDSTAPTFDEARARIDWEADQQAKQANRHRDAEEAKPKGTDIEGADASASGTGVKVTGPAGTGTQTGSQGTDAKVTGPKKKGTKGTGDRAGGTGTEASEDPDAPHRPKADVDRSGAAKPSAPSASSDQAPRSGDIPVGKATPSGDPAAAGDVDLGPGPRSPQQIAEDAERETARLELEDRQRKSAERLDQIRQELGIDNPPSP